MPGSPLKRARHAHYSAMKTTKLTPEVEAKILTHVEKGRPMESAAAMAGVHSRLIREWVRRGNSSEGEPFHSFALKLEAALAKGEDSLLGQLEVFTEGDWKGIAWMLERLYPKHFGQRARLEHSGPDGDAIPVDVKKSDLVEQLSKRLSGLAASSASGAAPPPDSE